MNSRVYPLKEAAGMVGINSNVLRVMINRGDVLGIQILKGTRLIWALTSETVDYLRNRKKMTTYQALVDEWVLEQKVGTHSGRPLSMNTINGHLNGLKGYWDRLGEPSSVPALNSEGFRQVMLKISVEDKCHYVLRRTIYDALCSFYHHLIRKGLKSELELRELQRLRPHRRTPERRTVLKREGLVALLKQNEKLQSRRKFDRALMKTLLLLYFGCGLRRNEVIPLRMRDLDLKRHELLVLGKGEKYRMVGVPKEVMIALKVWLKDFRPKSKRENLFLQENGLPLTDSLLQNRLERLRKQAKIDITYHGLRRGFATMAVQDGGMLPTEVQMALGHADLTTTERNYLMTEQGRAVSAMKKVKLFDKPSRKKSHSPRNSGKNKRKD